MNIFTFIKNKIVRKSNSGGNVDAESAGLFDLNGFKKDEFKKRLLKMNSEDRLIVLAKLRKLYIEHADKYDDENDIQKENKSMESEHIAKEKAKCMKSAAKSLFGWNADDTNAYTLLVKSFAFFRVPIADFQKLLNPILEKLAGMAIPELWSFKKNSDDQYSILRNYLAQTFSRLVYEDEKNSDNPNWLTKMRMDKNEGFALFNTGLVDKMYCPIYAFFSKNRNPEKQFWFFESFVSAGSKEGRGLKPKINELFGEDSILPLPAQFYEKKEEMVFDIDCGISESNLHHIIVENCNRYPIKFLKNCEIPFNYEALEESIYSGEHYRTKELYEQLRNVLNEDLSGKYIRTMQEKIKIALNETLNKVKLNLRIAKPIYYPETKTICQLLPLFLTSESEADVAVVLTYNADAKNYSMRTILTLEMAYNDARLIAKPEKEWLCIK